MSYTVKLKQILFKMAMRLWYSRVQLRMFVFRGEGSLSPPSSDTAEDLLFYGHTYGGHCNKITVLASNNSSIH